METICQSCTMPLTEDVLGTNADGTKNPDYCHYCFKDGTFVGDQTMDQMIETCIPFALGGAFANAEDARVAMQAQFPTLKRWKK